jgi:hypothetical protein
VLTLSGIVVIELLLEVLDRVRPPAQCLRAWVMTARSLVPSDDTTTADFKKPILLHKLFVTIAGSLILGF